MTSRNAVIICITLVIIVMLLNGHLMYGRVLMERQVNIAGNNVTRMKLIQVCSLRQGNYLEFYNLVWRKLLLIIGSIVPFALIVLGNAIVAISLIKSRRALRRVQHSSEGVVVDMTRQPSRNKSNYKMFFTICTVFLVTTVPYGVYLNVIDLGKTVDEHTLAKYQLSSVIMRCMYWSNYSLNFLLYCLTGSLFRNEFKRVIESAHTSLTSLTVRRSVQTQSSHTQ
jgi:hypothetical protein